VYGHRGYGAALGMAAFRGFKEVMVLLLDRGADVDTVCPHKHYGTALGAASYWGREEIVALLLDRGANINIVGGTWGTALAMAMATCVTAFKKDKKRIATMLLDRGADVNTLGGRYGTALGVAVYHGSSQATNLLLGRGADVNIVVSLHWVWLYTDTKEVTRLILRTCYWIEGQISILWLALPPHTLGV